jgi:hypothetical protein
MGFSNIIALAIILTTGATLHEAGVFEVQTSVQAAEALKPIAGEFAFILFALGIVGTGLWPSRSWRLRARLCHRRGVQVADGSLAPPKQSPGVLWHLTAAALLGVAITFSPIDPIKALYWA